MNWEFDSAVGVYKNNFMSNKLLVVSLAKCKVLPFTQDYGIGFGKNKGEYVNLMHIKELPDPTSAQLEEATRIHIDKLQFGNRVFRVTEYGRGVEYTNLAEQLGKFDPKSYLQKALSRQMERAMDTTAAKAFLDSTAVKTVFTPTSLTGGSFATNGVAPAIATFGLTFDHCTVLADYMTDTLHVPPFEGEDYIGLSCVKNLRSLKQDRLWQSVHLYLQKGDFFFMGEMGKTEKIRWVEINRAAAFASTSGQSTVLGEACVFGDEAVARIEVDTPQLYADPNYQSDFGRTKAVAWRGILAFGSVWDTASAGEAKIIQVKSL
jgi:N4-gp56 family major capsid protein